MIKFLLGMLTFFILSTSITTTNIYLSDTKQESKVMDFLDYHLMRGEYFAFPLTGRCNIPKNIQWFKCDKFQQLININLYTPKRFKEDN